MPGDDDGEDLWPGSGRETFRLTTGRKQFIGFLLALAVANVAYRLVYATGAQQSVRLWLPARRRRPRHRPVAPPERACDTGRIRLTGGHPGWFAGCVEHPAEHAEAEAERYLRRFAATSPRRRSRVAADAPVERIQ